MPRIALLLLAAALLGVGLFVLFGQGGDPAGDVDGNFDHEDASDYTADPALRASGTSRRPPRGDTQPDGPSTPPPAKDVVWMAGTVIDAASGRPVAGASLRFERAGTPCPRLPRHGGPTGKKMPESSSVFPPEDIIHAATAKDGSFKITRPASLPNPGAHDLFTFAPGYVTGCACAVAGEDIIVRLQPGLNITGRVVDPAGRIIEGASVRAAPLEGVTPVPGQVAASVTDREGRFTLGGLIAGQVMLTAAHKQYMPVTVGPREVADQTPLELRLTPAFRVSFHLRSDDGQSIINPTVRWVTDGKPPLEYLGIVSGTPVGPAASERAELKTETLLIPCDRRTVDIEIKADGYLPWRTLAEPLPADGGEQMFPVTLVRDRTVGALRFRIVDEAGTLVPYSENKARASLAWLGPPNELPTSFVLTATDVLDLPSMKAGPYRVTITGPTFAPIVTDVTVVAGELTERKVTALPPAKLKVRFVAAERLTVRFRITKDGRLAGAIPEGIEPAEPGADPNAPLSATGGGEGLVLSGMAGGAHVIEVLSKALVATRRTVTLTPGETKEIEIEVQRR